MDRDSLADLPADSRREIVAEVCAVLGVEAATAEDLIRSAEPLWDAMERTGGLVDSWGGGEICRIFPRVLAFIRSGAVGGCEGGSNVVLSTLDKTLKSLTPGTPPAH